ncbi:MAG: hypothetical protein ACO1Q7_03315 [Gemmatimonas sp.]
MRHSPFFRLLTALFGVWFTFTLIQPNGMMGMTMSGSGMPMNMSMPEGAGDPVGSMTAREMVAAGLAHCEGMAADAMAQDERAESGPGTHASMSHGDSAHASHDVSTETSPSKQTWPECDQHDCCCSALSPMSLMPVAALAWLPDHVINQHTPDTGQWIESPDAQIRLPFANAPPANVIA